MGYIYLIRNQINGKGYVGQTTWPIENRWRQHITDAMGDNKRKKYLIHKAFLKYGIENFSFNIVERTNNENLDEREKYWIKYWHTCIYDENCNGYNLTWGGGGNRIIDPDLILDLWNQGYSEGEIVKITNHSDIAISMILKSNGITTSEILNRGSEKAAEKNRIHIFQYDLKGNFIKEWSSLKEAAASISIYPGSLSEYLQFLELNKNGRRSCGGFLWTKTPEDLQKALDKYNNNFWKKNRPVGQFDLNDNLIQIFTSASEAGRKLQINPGQIRGVCNKKPKYKTAGGYIWKYMD